MVIKGKEIVFIYNFYDLEDQGLVPTYS